MSDVDLVPLLETSQKKEGNEVGRVLQQSQLIFLPPYSPELNPAEKIWAVLKRKFTNKIHFTLEEISDFIDKETHLLSKKIIQSICSFPYVFKGLDWTT